MPETILVTGGAGYIGAHVAVELAQAGYAPVLFDSFAQGSPQVPARVEALAGMPVPCVKGDVRDLVALRGVFHDHPIAGVVHCAELRGAAESEERPLAYYDVNVGGVLALAEVMGEAGVATLVFASSAAVYGQPQTLPVGEDAPLQPFSVYGRTKRVVEDFLGDLARANRNWRIAILRLCNPAGAHVSGSMGEAPRDPPGNLVPLLCRIAAGELSHLEVRGIDWPTLDGTAVRDYVHVQDVASGCVAALRHLARQAGVTTINLGTGRGHSVLEVLVAFERACGRRITRRIAPRRRGDVASCYADTARADAQIGWRAERDLDAICRDAWRWQQGGGRY